MLHCPMTVKTRYLTSLANIDIAHIATFLSLPLSKASTQTPTVSRSVPEESDHRSLPQFSTMSAGVQPS